MRKNYFAYLLGLPSYEDIMRECTSDKGCYDVCQRFEFWKTKIQQYPPKERQNLFAVSVINNHLYYVKVLLYDENVDPKFEDNFAIKTACYYGYADMVKILIPYADPDTDNNYCIRVAVDMNYNAVLYYLITGARDRIDPSVEDNRLVIDAYEKHNNLWMVRELARHPKVDVSTNDCYLVKLAARDNNHELIHFLLHDGRSDFSVGDNHCLKHAVISGDVSMVDIILNDDTVNPLVDSGYLLIHCMINGKKEKFYYLCLKSAGMMMEDEKVRNEILYAACPMQDIYYLDLLLKLGMIPNSRCLDIANNAGNKDNVKLLLHYGAKFN